MSGVSTSQYPSVTGVDDAPTGVVPSSHSETISARPDRRAVIQRVANDIGISPQKASRHLNWLDGLVARCRAYKGNVLLSSEDIRHHHDVFEAIIPARTTAEPGSLQADVESIVLDRSAGELGLWHDVDIEQGVKHCTVELVIVDVR